MNRPRSFRLFSPDPTRKSRRQRSLRQSPTTNPSFDPSGRTRRKMPPENNRHRATEPRTAPRNGRANRPPPPLRIPRPRDRRPTPPLLSRQPALRRPVPRRMRRRTAPRRGLRPAAGRGRRRRNRPRLRTNRRRPLTDPRRTRIVPARRTRSGRIRCGLRKTTAPIQARARRPVRLRPPAATRGRRPTGRRSTTTETNSACSVRVGTSDGWMYGRFLPPSRCRSLPHSTPQRPNAPTPQRPTHQRPTLYSSARP